jgi:ribosomal protein S18 acetylase RimI-like enzyme
MPYVIRPTVAQDLASFGAIRATFRSPTTLRVTKRTTGLSVSWEIDEASLPEPYDKGDAYDLVPEEVEEIARRLRRPDCFGRVAEAAGRVVAMVDLEISAWNNVGTVWNLLVDVGWRGQGIGQALFRRAVAWCRRRSARSLMIETQTNNVPACRFYERMGCRLAGINDHYYTNRDIEHGEVAIFWAYDLSDKAPTAFHR